MDEKIKQLLDAYYGDGDYENYKEEILEFIKSSYVELFHMLKEEMAE